MLRVLLICLLVGMPLAHGEELSSTGNFPADASALSVTGIEGVQAIAGTGVVDGEAVMGQALVGNRVEEGSVIRQAVIGEAFQGNAGIVSVNQSAGNLDNQANVRAIAMGEDTGPLQFLSATGTAVASGNVVNSSGPRETRIENSFNDTVGIVGVNQSAGNLNQQLNAVVLAAGTLVGPDAIALGDSMLSSVGARNDNTVNKDRESPRQNVMTDSFRNFRGIAQINQTAGDLNRVGNAVGMSISVMNLP